MSDPRADVELIKAVNKLTDEVGCLGCGVWVLIFVILLLSAKIA